MAAQQLVIKQELPDEPKLTSSEAALLARLAGHHAKSPNESTRLGKSRQEKQAKAVDPRDAQIQRLQEQIDSLSGENGQLKAIIAEQQRAKSKEASIKSEPVLSTLGAAKVEAEDAKCQAVKTESRPKQANKSKGRKRNRLATLVKATPTFSADDLSRSAPPFDRLESISEFWELWYEGRENTIAVKDFFGIELSTNWHKQRLDSWRGAAGEIYELACMHDECPNLVADRLEKTRVSAKRSVSDFLTTDLPNALQIDYDSDW